MGNINELELKAIPELLGKNFFIPDYQRGYRWTELNINQLLSDIWDFTNNGKADDFYCLQPIVLKECTKDVIEKYKLESNYDNNRWYEVIDGQQRLTTIRLILQLNNLLQPLLKISNTFNVFYETRPELTNIFNSLSLESNNGELSVAVNSENIDSFYITSGLSNILKWFTTEGEKYENRASIHQFATFFAAFFGSKEGASKSTQVLWYLVNEDSDKAKSIFKRLNDSKIPLSNSELIKALFLSENSYYKPEFIEDKKNQPVLETEKKQKQNHIAKTWELYEHNLGNKSFWSFITNRKNEKYSSNIELLFDYISRRYTPEKAKEGLNKNDTLYTFLYFDQMLRSGEDLWDIWLKIEQFYNTLVYWYEDRELYHKIGYLATVTDDTEVIYLLDSATKINKDEFLEVLDKKIRDTINFDIENLNYEKSKEQLKRFLILYNIETTRKLENKEFYPFDLHKGKIWSLEHIHAQNSDYLNRDNEEEWRIWLREHISTLKNLVNADYVNQEEKIKLNFLLEDLIKTNELPKIDFTLFLNEFNKILKFFESLENTTGSYATHSIANIALLGLNENSVLNNSVFETKRKLILQMDANGIYIPICTRNVFLKYYNINNGNFDTQQAYYWSTKDKNNYLKDILKVMEPYINKNSFSTLEKIVDLKNTISNE